VIKSYFLGILDQASIKQKKAIIMYDNLCTTAMSNIKMHMIPTDATNNNIVASNYNFSLVAIQRWLHDKTFMTPSTSIAKKIAQQTHRFTKEWQVIVVGNTYYVPTLASIYYEICLENLDEKHIADELYGGRVPTLWCSYKFGLFYFF
jgi:hypothetical protein